MNLFAQGLLHGTTHTCIGQEHVPVALSHFQEEGDWIFSNHRGHGHYLARFGDLDGLLGELLGMPIGICRGHGGSQHLYRPGYLSSGVLGQLAGVSVGVAFSLNKAGKGRLTWLYMGDGAWGEGAVYESLNMAKLLSAPLILVVENNDIAQTTPTTLAMSGTIRGRCEAFGIEYLGPIEGGIPEIRSAVESSVESRRRVPGPLVIEFKVPRLGAHSKGDDTRTPAERLALNGRDVIATYRDLFGDLYTSCEHEAEARVREAFQRLGVNHLGSRQA